MFSNPPNPTLLLAEDDENDIFFFNRTFRKAGSPFVIHQVSNGASAIEYLQAGLSSNSLPRLIFLDLKMPIMNGFDVLIWMQQQPFPSPIPVIVLSGSDEQRDKDRARQLGATEYLVKPVRVADFLRVVQAHVPKAENTGTPS